MAQVNTVLKLLFGRRRRGGEERVDEGVGEDVVGVEALAQRHEVFRGETRCQPRLYGGGVRKDVRVVVHSDARNTILIGAAVIFDSRARITILMRPALGALPPRGGPIKGPVLTVNRVG